MSNDTKRTETAGGHSYKLDGTKVDGVTTILGNGIPKPALVGWAAKSIAEYVGERITITTAGTVDATTLAQDLATIGRENRYSKWPNDGSVSRLAFIETLKGVHWQDRDRAAKRGTEVHALAERIIQGEEIDVPAELVGHVDSYIKFLDEWQVSPIVVEGVCGHRKHRWMGTFDLVADLHGERWLLDLKTTRSGIFGETALQLAAYRHAEFYIDPDGDEQPMPEVDHVGAVWCRADGYDLIPVEAGPDQYRMFQYAQMVARFTTELGKQWVHPALQPGQVAA
jgi:hypothetical protein